MPPRGPRPSAIGVVALTSRIYDSTYDLFSGGRAISENLQLDRVLRPAKPGEDTVAIAHLTGITVREMDWKPLVKDLKPKTDALACLHSL